MAIEITKLPWEPAGCTIFGQWEDGRGQKLVADFSLACVSGSPPDEVEANVIYACTAVNKHDALVEMVEKLAKISIGKLASTDHSPFEFTDLQCLQREARALLKEVEDARQK